MMKFPRYHYTSSSMEIGCWLMRVSPIQMVDAVIYYFVRHIKVDAISCILALRIILKASKQQAFIHLLRFPFIFLCLLCTFQIKWSHELSCLYYFCFFLLLFWQIAFDCSDQNGHYHIPLLLNPYGYTTYRGS